MWLLDENGNAFNLDKMTTAWINDYGDGTFGIWTGPVAGTGGWDSDVEFLKLAPRYNSLGDAKDALRRIFEAIDPADIP